MACLPFESPKLIATAVLNEGSFAELLDRRLERMKQMNLIEQKPTNTNGGPQIDVRPPLPLLADRPLARNRRDAELF